MRLSFLILLSFYFLNLEAQDPSWIRARFIDFGLDETTEPLPQIIEDFDIYLFNQSAPAAFIDSLLLTYDIVPTDVGVLDELKIALDETELFDTLIIMNSLMVSSNEIQKEKVEFKILPNPVSDVVNVMINHEESLKAAEIILSNNVGQRLKAYPIQLRNLTMMIDVSGLESGMYYLSYVVDGVVLRTEGFVRGGF